MTPMMSAILRELLWMASMVLTTSPTTAPPRAATSAAEAASWLAWRAASVDCCTVAVICSMLCAVDCRLLAVCSVRALRSWLPLAISTLALVMPSTAERTCSSRRR